MPSTQLRERGTHPPSFSPARQPLQRSGPSLSPHSGQRGSKIGLSRTHRTHTPTLLLYSNLTVLTAIYLFTPVLTFELDIYVIIFIYLCHSVWR